MGRSRLFAVILIAVCLLPLAALMASALLAGMFGCELSEAATASCVIAGLDVGPGLSALFVGGWMALFTIPLLAAVLGVWATFEAVGVWRKRRRARRDARREHEETA